MIHNIHILIHDDPLPTNLQIQAAIQNQLIADHRRGQHPDGEKIRACPLCQIGK